MDWSPEAVRVLVAERDHYRTTDPLSSTYSEADAIAALDPNLVERVEEHAAMRGAPRVEVDHVRGELGDVVVFEPKADPKQDEHRFESTDGTTWVRIVNGVKSTLTDGQVLRELAKTNPAATFAVGLDGHEPETVEDPSRAMSAAKGLRPCDDGRCFRCERDREEGGRRLTRIVLTVEEK